MIAPLSTLILAASLGAPLSAGATTELRYTGSLTQVARDAEGQTVKRFSLYCLVQPAAEGATDLTYFVDERGGGSWPWPARFGRVALGGNLEPVGPSRPRLLYDHQGNLNAVRLQWPLFENALKLEGGATGNLSSEAFEVQRQPVKISNRSCWQIDVSTNFGRKRTVWVEQKTPLIVAYDERVFMGQGDEFVLKVQLESAEELTAEQTAVRKPPLDILLKLQADLQRDENDQNPELTDDQLAKAAAVATELEKVAENTPFSRLASVVSRDVKLQMQRTDDVVQLAKKYIGQPAPDLTLSLLDKEVVDPKSLAGKITVLHFWEYQGEPLVEPYGQVGYLDYLFSRRKKLGVQVFGVAVDPRFGEKDKASAAVRSANKLKSFMNLAYPIGTDNGELIGKFGDPRQVGAKLPLWVVIGADGKIAHYSVGFFKINPDEGLRALDDVVVKLIQSQRGKDAKE